MTHADVPGDKQTGPPLGSGRKGVHTPHPTSTRSCISAYFAFDLFVATASCLLYTVPVHRSEPVPGSIFASDSTAVQMHFATPASLLTGSLDPSEYGKSVLRDHGPGDFCPWASHVFPGLAKTQAQEVSCASPSVWSLFGRKCLRGSFVSQVHDGRADFPILTHLCVSLSSLSSFYVDTDEKGDPA